MVTVFLFLPLENVQAECVIQSGDNQVALVDYRWPNSYKFGAFVNSFSKSSITDCDHYLTQVDKTALNPAGGNLMSGKVFETGKTFSESWLDVYYAPSEIHVQAKTEAIASISDFSVYASAYLIPDDPHYDSKNFAQVVDLILVQKPSAEPQEETLIPFEYCSELTSEIDGGGVIGRNESFLSYGDFGYLSENENYEDYRIEGMFFFFFFNARTIAHTGIGKVCNTGHIKMFGRYHYFTIGLKTFTEGNLGTQSQILGGVNFDLPIRNGQIEASFSWDLPEGVKCHSESGVFPGCFAPKPQKTPNGCEASIGNPINFSLGFKHQTETDYANGVLSFKRYYRSDADWYAHSVGQRWRHIYDRFIVVTGNRATVTNEAGLVHTFEDDGSGNWSPIADDHDLTATLESIPAGYLYTTPSDTREYYNTNGRLTRVEFRGGESLNLTYDALNRLASVSDESGRSLGFSYNGSDKPIISMSTPDGVYSYGYGLNNNLTTVTKPDTKTRTYHYEDTNFINALTGITDENGVRYATYGYDDQGRAISSEHAGGVNNHTIAYNADDSVTTTNPLGKQTTYHFETILGVRKVVNVEGHQSAHCAAANKTNIYDERGFLKSKTDWIGNVTTYERDARGLVTSMTEAAGSGAQRSTTYTYDSVYRLPETITETGKITTYQYDAEGRTVSESVADTNSGEIRTTTYTYHPNTIDSFGNAVLGRLASIDGPRTDVTDITNFEYDPEHNLTKITNALGHETEMLQFDASGRPTLIEDSNGIRTRMVYDPQGRLLRVAQGTNTSIKAVTRHVYDDKGQLVKTIAPNGTFLRYAYDDAGRLIRIINSDSKILYTLDNAGNRIREVYKDSAGVVRYKHRQVFDELSRVIRDIDDNGDKTRYAYNVNGNLTKIIDGNANKTRFVYDALDRQTRTVDALDRRTAQTFNELDQLTRVKDPRDNATRYVYNAFGDVIREISPDTGKTVNKVDAAGNVVRRKDARDVITRYKYDALNRLTNIVYPSDPSLNVVLVYDSGSGCGYSIGRLCEIRDASGTTQYSYDALGRLTQVIETQGNRA